MFGVTNNGSQHKFQFIKSGVRYIFDYITWFSNSTKIHNITIIKKVNSYSLYIDTLQKARNIIPSYQAVTEDNVKCLQSGFLADKSVDIGHKKE